MILFTGLKKKSFKSFVSGSPLKFTGLEHDRGCKVTSKKVYQDSFWKENSFFTVGEESLPGYKPQKNNVVFFRKFTRLSR